MNTLTVTDEQYQIILFALSAYEEECKKDMQALSSQKNGDKSDGEFYVLSQHQARQAAKLSLEMKAQR